MSGQPEFVESTSPSNAESPFREQRPRLVVLNSAFSSYIGVEYDVIDISRLFML